VKLVGSKTEGEPIKSEEHLNTLVVRMLKMEGEGASNSDSVVADYMADIRLVFGAEAYGEVQFPLTTANLERLAQVS